MNIIEFPQKVTNNSDGFEFLAKLCLIKSTTVGEIIWDFKNTNWLDAHFCSPLAAILYELSQDGIKPRIINVIPSIKNVLMRNGFAYQFMEIPGVVDLQRTIIICRRFVLEENASFENYILNELLSWPGFPKFSSELKKKISKSILEIFINAHIHGKCNCVYTCGQYYPSIKTLRFTISDMGYTIRKNVNSFLKEKRSGAQSIEWAVQEGHTTRTGSIPGGLGLSLIRDFLTLNGGAIEIISSDGHWKEENQNSEAKDLHYRFRGTIVTLRFDLADEKTYKLASETDYSTIW